MNIPDDAKFLIVKTSALGDIIQAFDALSFLRSRCPLATIDWVVEERFLSIVKAHPQVTHAIPIDIKSLSKRWKAMSFWRDLFSAFKKMRATRYDVVFDLQGNCKSGLITFLSRARIKVGFGRLSVREWPNIFATKIRFEIPRGENIRHQYVFLMQKFFREENPYISHGVIFRTSEEDVRRIQDILSAPQLKNQTRVMVCPGSQWVNKELPLNTLTAFLELIHRASRVSFLLVWGNEREKMVCDLIQSHFLDSSAVVERLDLPALQNLMGSVDVVIAVDSAPLHLCATTRTPSFAVFGPTRPEVFNPVGPRHYAYQGECPLKKVFEKQCPHLRTCKDAGCTSNIPASVLFSNFNNWKKHLIS